MLVLTVDDLKKCVPVDLATRYKTIQPSFESVERNYIVKILGKVTYNKLNAGVNDNNLTSDQKELLGYVLPVLAPIAYAENVATLGVRFSDAGIYVNTGKDGVAITKWQLNQVRMELLSMGYKAIDPLFEFLESGAGKDWYADWQASKADDTYRELFIQTAQEFNEYVGIYSSTWLYIMLKPFIRKTQELYLSASIGRDFYVELKGKLITGMSAGEKIILPFIRQALSNLAYSKALRDPFFRTEFQNLQLVKNDNAGNSGSATEDNNYFEQLADQYERDGIAFLGLLTDELNVRATSSLFETFYNSNKFKGKRATVSTSTYNNSTAEGTYFM